MTTLPRRRAGFTLIELLMVITIIMILASATFGLYRGVSNTRMKARGRGEIQRIIIACENFKKTYGDYPCAVPGTSVSTSAHFSGFRTDLFDQLSGRRIIFTRQIATGGFAVEIWPYNSPSLPNGANRKPKPFVAFDDIPVTVVSTRLDAVPADLANIATTQGKGPCVHSDGGSRGGLRYRSRASGPCIGNNHRQPFWREYDIHQRLCR